MHLNIPIHDFTTETETKGELKQNVGVTQPTKHLASNSSRAKAADKKAPTIVPPIITAMAQSSGFLEACAVTQPRPNGADKVLCTGSEKAMLHNGNMSPWGPSRAEDSEANTSVQPPLVMESHARRSESKSPSGEALTKSDIKTVCNGPIAWSDDLQLSKSPGSATQQQDNGWDQVSRGPGKGEWNDSQSPGEKGETVPPSVTVQVQPIAPV